MANEEILNRLTTILETLTTAPQPSRQSRIVYLNKEIQHIPTFAGESGDLSQFIASVQTHLDGLREPLRSETWQTIYNSKIIGKAKELLLNNRPDGWEATQKLLKQHFRPVCSYKEISRKIGNLKVSSIQELNEKIESLTQEINQFIVYEENPTEAKQTFYTLLTNKIKQVVSGNLSREIKELYSLHQIKEILYSYVGYDHNNLDREFLSQDRRIQNSNQKSRNNWKETNHNPFRQNNNNFNSNHNPFRQNNNNFNSNFSRQYNNNFRENNNNFNHSYNRQNYNGPSTSGQHRGNNQPIFNPSGQIRNSTQNPIPMSVDQTESREETNNLEFFLN